MPLNTAYDFDLTLADSMWGKLNPIKKEVQARAKRDISLGYNVFIITKRYAKIEKESKPVYELARELGIPVENIIFTNRKEKVLALKENKIDLFLEDELQSLNITRAANFSIVISIFKEYNDGLSWQSALDLSEKKLLEFYRKKIHVAGDHGGFDVKTTVKNSIKRKFKELVDYGCQDAESCDYPDFGKKVAQAVQNSDKDMGILFCSTGQGMAMTANRFSGVRAALCWNVEIARLARKHNDANIVCIPSKHIRKREVEEILHVFFSTDFDGGRHQRRVEKIDS